MSSSAEQLEAPNRFKRTPIQRFPRVSQDKNDQDVNFWRDLQFPVSVQESSGPVHRLDIATVSPHLIAVTGSARIQVYDPESNEVVKSFTKFKEGLLRRPISSRWKAAPGAGTAEGIVKLFDLDTKTQLRQFKGHSQATRRADFLSDHKSLVSFSDDRTVKLWDVATEQQLSSFEEHTDYVRAGCAANLSSDLVISGSYDHTVRVWDRRKSASVFKMEHGSPVEDVLLLPNDALLVTAGGHDIKVWDLLVGGNLLAKFSPHNKTITCLGLANGNRRLLSASLDCHIKFHDLTTFRSVHHIKFPSPVLTACVSPDDGFIAAGMSDGLVQFLHRKPTDRGKEAAAAMLEKPQFKYLRFTDFSARPGDVIVKQDKRDKEARHDTFLRKFEHSKALDAVLKPYVQKKHPEYTYSILQELKRRRALKSALAGRNDKTIVPILNYVTRYINDARFSNLLVEVSNEILDLYGNSLGGQPNTDRLFIQLRKTVDREARNLRQLMMLQGSLDLILAASRSHVKPSLRCEELIMARKRKEQGTPVMKGLNLSMDRVLL